jgi:hypothetical protein
VAVVLTPVQTVVTVAVVLTPVQTAVTVAVVLTPVQTTQIRKNVHNQTIQNTVNTSTHITKTPTYTHSHNTYTHLHPPIYDWVSPVCNLTF